MNTQSQILWNDVLKVCTALHDIKRRGQENLQLGLPAIACAEEQARLVTAIELLHCAIFERSTMTLDSSHQANNPTARPFLYLV